MLKACQLSGYMNGWALHGLKKTKNSMWQVGFGIILSYTGK